MFMEDWYQSLSAALPPRRRTIETVEFSCAPPDARMAGAIERSVEKFIFTYPNAKSGWGMAHGK
jgi:hypothetical protein